MADEVKAGKVTVRVYLRNSGGAVYEYDVTAETQELAGTKAREHLGQIASGGFRASDSKGTLEWFPPHWIDKVKLVGLVSTDYPTRSTGT